MESKLLCQIRIKRVFVNGDKHTLPCTKRSSTKAGQESQESVSCAGISQYKTVSRTVGGLADSRVEFSFGDLKKHY